MTQAEALNILKSGANVFLTGEPGSGKTHTINEFVTYLRAHGINPAVTASTGIAATHINGMTIHAWSGIGVKDELDKYDVDRIATNQYVNKRVRATTTLIIDEISMLSPDTLMAVDQVCREVKQDQRPFGGLQVVLVGDFFQLPPVTKSTGLRQATLFTAEPARFAYQSSVWAALNSLACYLTEQHRTEDAEFVRILAAIRQNTLSLAQQQLLQTRMGNPVDVEVPQLYTHNVDVDRVNDERLDKLAQPLKTFTASAQGPAPLVAALTRGCLSPEKLRLKLGAAVMFTKNNTKEGYVNGTLGSITGFTRAQGLPIVLTRQGKTIITEAMDWHIEENGQVRARIRQIPLRLAWAITVHKSQGMSLDAAVVDLAQVFAYGQGYVALSRVRRLSGLTISGWHERAGEVDPEVLQADAGVRVASAEAQEFFGHADPAELMVMQENFIRACGGKIAVKVVVDRVAIVTGFTQLREKYPNAYRRWGRSEDESLKTLFTAGIKRSDLARRLGRKSGAITSRLIKLGLIPT